MYNAANTITLHRFLKWHLISLVFSKNKFCLDPIYISSFFNQKCLVTIVLQVEMPFHMTYFQKWGCNQPKFMLGSSHFTPNLPTFRWSSFFSLHMWKILRNIPSSFLHAYSEDAIIFRLIEVELVTLVSAFSDVIRAYNKIKYSVFQDSQLTALWVSYAE